MLNVGNLFMSHRVHFAECVCGWTSTEFSSRIDAQSEANKHLDQAHVDAVISPFIEILSREV